MKTFKLLIILLSLLTIFACKQQQSKKAENKPSAIIKQTTEKNIDKSDLKTDVRKADNPLEHAIIKKVDISEQLKLKQCESLIKEILTTSPRYRELTKGLDKAVVKNGGQFFGVSLEGSPNPGIDMAWSYSKTYDFTVYEMYSDRQLNTARFTFDPGKRELYEYDALHDQLKQIDFDKKLLLKYDTICK